MSYDPEEQTRDEQYIGSVVLLKLVNGDLIAGIHMGYDDDNSFVLQNPLVITATAGYLLMTDYAPFLSQAGPEPTIHLNPNQLIYVEPLSQKISDYYSTCITYRDMIRSDMDDILDKSHELIRKTMATITQERAEEAAADPTAIKNHMDAPITSVLNKQLDGSIKGVVDFQAVLAEAMKNKKDKLN